MHPHFDTPDRAPWKKRRYLVANRTDAVIYAENEDGGLHFVRRLRNPSGRRHENTLVSDRPGSVQSSAGKTIRHALDRNSLHHEEKAKKFAARIVRNLWKEHEHGDCQGLILVAEPHFLGLLRSELPDPLWKIVLAEVPREFVYLSDEEVSAQVRRSLGA